MSRLPDARRAIHGRTWSRAWNPAEMDPIERPVPRWERFADRALAVALGVSLGLLAVMWASA